MSPVKVTVDGQMVDRSAGSVGVGNTGRKITLGYSTIEMAGAILDDEIVEDGLLELIKSGDGPAGLAYFDTVEEARGESVELSPEAIPPQSDQDLNPGRGSEGGGESGGESEYKDDPDFDPDKHVQAQVLDYLKSASPAEVERVKAAEADGQDRQGIASYSTPSPFEG